MLDETPDLLNQNIIIILRNRQFFADLEELNKILAPIKKACTILESNRLFFTTCNTGNGNSVIIRRIKSKFSK